MARKAKPEKEAVFQRRIINKAREEHGWRVNWIPKTYRNMQDPGWPDLVLHRDSEEYGPQLIFIEVKTDRGYPTKSQLESHEILGEYAPVFIIRQRDEKSGRLDLILKTGGEGERFNSDQDSSAEQGLDESEAPGSCAQEQLPGLVS